MVQIIFFERAEMMGEEEQKLTSSDRMWLTTLDKQDRELVFLYATI